METKKAAGCPAEQTGDFKKEFLEEVSLLEI